MHTKKVKKKRSRKEPAKNKLMGKKKYLAPGHPEYEPVDIESLKEHKKRLS